MPWKKKLLLVKIHNHSLLTKLIFEITFSWLLVPIPQFQSICTFKCILRELFNMFILWSQTTTMYYYYYYYKVFCPVLMMASLTVQLLCHDGERPDWSGEGVIEGIRGVHLHWGELPCLGVLPGPSFSPINFNLEDIRAVRSFLGHSYSGPLVHWWWWDPCPYIVVTFSIDRRWNKKAPVRFEENCWDPVSVFFHVSSHC